MHPASGFNGSRKSLTDDQPDVRRAGSSGLPSATTSNGSPGAPCPAEAGYLQGAPSACARLDAWQPGAACAPAEVMVIQVKLERQF